MKLFLTVVVVCLSGCSSIADYYDSQDPCQQQPYPSFCGSSKRILIYDSSGTVTGYIKKDP